MDELDYYVSEREELWRHKYHTAVERFRKGLEGEDTFRAVLFALDFRGQEIDAEVNLAKMEGQTTQHRSTYYDTTSYSTQRNFTSRPSTPQQMFDWISFLESRRIPYRDSGPNVSRGGIVLSCPWCGSADSSEHMVISLEGKGFKCWRDRSHAGINPARLIQALLNCSWQQANELAGQNKPLPNDFMAKINNILNKQEVVQKPNNLKLPPEFKPFSTLPSCKPYWAYIRSRGFILKDAQEFDIRYASQGNYKGRIIFPVVVNGELCGWTGRTIYPQEIVRYKTLSDDPETARQNNESPAPNPISNYLLFHDKLRDSDTIVLAEGPFDAWRLNCLGREIGLVATCFFTSTLSKAQLNLLHELLPRFKNRFLLLDQNTFAKAARMRSDLISLGVVVKTLPREFKDPAEISSVKELKKLLAIV